MIGAAGSLRLREAWLARKPEAPGNVRWLGKDHRRDRADGRASSCEIGSVGSRRIDGVDCRARSLTCRRPAMMVTRGAEAVSSDGPIEPQSLTTPRSAAIAGVIFSLLLSLAMVMIWLSIPTDPEPNGRWIAEPTERGWVKLALNLLPFAGIAFLWFIGVIRDRIGRHEDRFFATVLLGSGLLFVAMLFVTGAVAAGLTQEASTVVAARSTSEMWRIDGRITGLLLNIYAMKMAAVFMIAVATISLRTHIIPRWLTFFGYGTAAVLLLGSGSVLTRWVQLLFPLWVLVLSVDILWRSRSRSAGLPPPLRA